MPNSVPNNPSPQATAEGREQAATVAKQAQGRVHVFGEATTLTRDVATLCRLVLAWAEGRYGAVPWATVLMAAAALLYFLNPFDAVPDMLPLIGLTDDAAVLTGIIAAVRSDLEQFRSWEQRRDVRHERDR